MDDLDERLGACFAAVLPELPQEEIRSGTAASLPGWDSVTTVTLLALLEEEFGIDLTEEDPGNFDSYKKILAYLRQAGS